MTADLTRDQIETYRVEPDADNLPSDVREILCDMAMRSLSSSWSVLTNTGKIHSPCSGCADSQRCNTLGVCQAAARKPTWENLRSLDSAPSAIREKWPDVVAWIIPGDDTAKDNGSIDAMAWQEGEFSRPLYGEAALNDAYCRGRTDGWDAAKATQPAERAAAGMTVPSLPELPKNDGWLDRNPMMAAFTVPQMIAYGRECMRTAMLAAPQSTAPEERDTDAQKLLALREAYAEVRRLRAAIEAQMSEEAKRGNLWQNSWCRDWPAYEAAVKRREALLEVITAPPMDCERK